LIIANEKMHFLDIFQILKTTFSNLLYYSLLQHKLTEKAICKKGQSQTETALFVVVQLFQTNISP
jgi:hypothetical protein